VYQETTVSTLMQFFQFYKWSGKYWSPESNLSVVESNLSIRHFILIQTLFCISVPYWNTLM